MDTSRKDEAGNALLLCYNLLCYCVDTGPVPEAWAFFFFLLGYMTWYLGKFLGPRVQRSEENPIFVAY